MIYDIQKAGLWKRISAFLLDFILFLIIAVGIASLMSAVLKYDEKMDIIESRKAYYVDRCEAEYEKMHGEKRELDLSIAYEDMSDAQKEMYDMLDKYLGSDRELNITYKLLLNYTLLMAVVGTIVSYVILDFVVPLCLKNGQTLGKKIFSIGVVRTNAVKASPVVLFVRMLLGRCTIETLVPMFIIIMMFFGIIGIVGPIVLLGIVILEIVMMCVTHTNSTIHDLLADTVVVDISTQLIFDTEQDMIEYKKKLHAEEVARADY